MKKRERFIQLPAVLLIVLSDIALRVLLYAIDRQGLVKLKQVDIWELTPAGMVLEFGKFRGYSIRCVRAAFRELNQLNLITLINNNCYILNAEELEKWFNDPGLPKSGSPGLPKSGSPGLPKSGSQYVQECTEECTEECTTNIIKEVPNTKVPNTKIIEMVLNREKEINADPRPSPTLKKSMIESLYETNGVNRAYAKSL